PALLEMRRRGELAEMEFVHDGQQEDLEAHHMDLRSLGHDDQRIAVRLDAQVAVLEAEDAQEVDEVGLQVRQARQVGELVLGKGKAAERVDFPLDRRDQPRERLLRDVPAKELVACRIGRIRMEQRLPHAELVEVGGKQALDDGFGHGLLAPRLGGTSKLSTRRRRRKPGGSRTGSGGDVPWRTGPADRDASGPGTTVEAYPGRTGASWAGS